MAQVDQSKPQARQARAKAPAGPRQGPKFRWYLRWGLVLFPWLVLIYEAARIAPIYYNYVKVARSLDAVAADFHEGDDPESLARKLAQHFKQEGVVRPEVKDIGVSRDGSQWLIEARYDDEATLLFNVAVVVSFDKLVHAPKVAAP